MKILKHYLQRNELKIRMKLYSRSKTVAEELLKGYTGVVQTDGFQSYGSGDYENADVQ